MTYRLLDVDKEWHLVKPEFDKRNAPMPSPLFGMIIGAFDVHDNFTGAFAVVQMQVHLEPIMAYDPHTVLGLVHKAEEEIESKLGQGVEYYTTATGRIGELAEAFGAEKLPVNIYRKRVS